MNTQSLTMLDWMSNRIITLCVEPTRTINCRFGDILIPEPGRFQIAEFAQYGGRGWHPFTVNL